MKNVLKIILVIMGTLIGAGFASGREIYLFFGKFGKLGIIGILISGILTGIIIYITLKIINKKDINNYDELLEKINIKNKYINLLIKNIITIFLLISFYIMVAAFSAYMNQTYEILIYISSIIFAFFAYIIFIRNIQGMIKVNEILVPILLMLILYLGIKNVPYLLETKNVLDFDTVEKGFFINSILYTSYNSIMLIPILITMKKYINNEKQIKQISVISSILIILLSFCIFGLLLKGKYYIENVEMPLLSITMQFGKIYLYIYSFIIITSIFTTAISAGYSFLENVSKNKKQYKVALIFMSVTSILVSNIGFSKLVEILYPLFGILGIIQIIFLIKENKYKKGIMQIYLKK